LFSEFPAVGLDAVLPWLTAECAYRNLRLEIPARLPNQPRPRLGEHCQGGATKRKPGSEAPRFIWTTL